MHHENPAAAPTGARARIFRAAVRLFAESGRPDVTVSEIAEAAGIARGTIYNNIEAPEHLFGDVATALAQEMIARTDATMHAIDAPAERIATGIRLFVRRAHEEPDWGRFLTRYALENSALSRMMRDTPARDIRNAIRAGAFTARLEATPALLSMLTGATLAAMSAVIHGDQTWRSAGGGAAEFYLRACGVNAVEARRLCARPLAPLAPQDSTQRRPERRKTS